METTEAQISVFLITLYGGMAAAIIYDIYRAIRRAAKNGRFATALLDALFILTLGAVITFMLYIANQGELRLYTFAGFALGFALYMTGLSPFIFFLCRKIKKRLSK
ncbi:MAG: spore cortex biosynthesis protein YabQ [Christensenellales bacterium]